MHYVTCIFKVILIYLNILELINSFFVLSKNARSGVAKVNSRLFDKMSLMFLLLTIWLFVYTSSSYFDFATALS